jgi:hypothetical protein
MRCVSIIIILIISCDYELNQVILCSISSLPALFYYAQHGYCEEKEVDIQILKRNFGNNHEH